VAKSRNRRRQPPPQAAKALARNASGAAMTSTEVLAAAFAAGQAFGSATPMPRDTFPYSMGPGVASPPSALDPVRSDSGRPEPRIFEYDPSWNLPGSGSRHRLVPWKTLRDAADNIPLFRRCIEIRKNETVSTEWDIALTKRAVQTAQRADPGASRAQAEESLRKDLDPHIDRLVSFWRTPDQSNGYTFAEWLGQLLEEHYVLDAIAIYPRYTYGGELYSLEMLDGSTVKPLLDHRGGRPAPPFPAYQQILWGFPRGEFTADTNHGDNGQDIKGGYPSDQLIYIRRAVRTWTPYGYSAVEQALNDGDLYMRRYQWLKSEYTDGVMPSGWLQHSTAAGQNSWTPQQLLEYERDFNDFYSGDTHNRRRFRILPPGLEPADSTDASERYKPEYDLHLIKLLASHFDVSISELGFTEAKGLGSAGYHEGQADVQDRKGRLPLVSWLASVLTDISRQHLGMPEELEFRFLGLESEDEAAADEVAGSRVGEARMTINEDRDRQGLPRFAFPEADMPFIRTSRGIVFMDGASQLMPAGEPVDQVAGAPLRDGDADGILDAPQGPDADIGRGAPVSAADDELEDRDAGREAAVKAERTAFRRWAAKRSAGSRPFQCAVLTKADAPELAADDRIVFADPTPGGDGDPKVGSPPAGAWPGWGHDEAIADVWATRIQQAATQGVDLQALAERWLSSGLTDAAPNEEPPPDSHAARDIAAAAAAAWLLAQGIDLTAGLMRVIGGLWMEGWALGTASAGAVLRGERTIRLPWRAGDTTSARRVLAPSQERELANWSRSLADTLREIADRRRDALGLLLAGFRGGRRDSVQLAQDIRALLTDPTWAHRLALTELSRAQAQAAAAIYKAAGITRWQWTTEPGACPACLANEAEGPIPLGQGWPDGSYSPPGHPNCRCSLLPAP
jgi:hypothetical protein